MRKMLRRVTALFHRFTAVSCRYPALDIKPGGDRLFHLVGSIHMGTRDMSPLPQALLIQLQRADALVVEADITSDHSPFAAMPPEAPLAERLKSDETAQLQRLCGELAIDPRQIDTLPGWQIALMFQAQQAQRLGLRTHYGIDYQLLQQAKVWHKPVIELEGADTQLAMLQALPDNGLPLLRDTLTHWHTNARLLQTMMSRWLSARPDTRKLVLPSTFSDELNDVLMSRRNQNWRDRLLALPAGRYVVAVGALHLYGEENLPSLLSSA